MVRQQFSILFYFKYLKSQSSYFKNKKSLNFLKLYYIKRRDYAYKKEVKMS